MIINFVITIFEKMYEIVIIEIFDYYPWKYYTIYNWRLSIQSIYLNNQT